MENFVKTRPKTVLTLAGVVLFLAFEALGILGSIWSLFSSTPLFQWLTERWPGMTYEIFWWIRLVFYCGIVGLLVKILWAIHQQGKEGKKYESIQKELATAGHTIEKLQEKIRTIEDIQPLLKTESFPTERTPRHDFYSRTFYLRDRVGCFALLRVTNEPDNLNSDAIAYHIHARITYYDEQWKPLFRTVDGVWFDLDWDHDPTNIRSPRSKPERLSPHKSVYLGVALRYKREGSHFHALCADSQQSPDWLNPEFKLSRETTYLRISITCHSFHKDYGYVLKSPDSQDGFQLEPVDLPA
jgi:hypothetical protein